MRRSRTFALTALTLLGLTLSACGGGGTTTAHAPAEPHATVTPTALSAPPLKHLALGAFHLDNIVPGPHGLVLFGAPVDTSAPPPPPGGGGAPFFGTSPALYFYDTASDASVGTVLKLDTLGPAPDGTPRGIGDAVAGGDWLAYVIMDTHATNWELWALNVVSNQKHLVDSAVMERQGPNGQWRGIMVTDGTTLVWSPGDIDGPRRHTLACGATSTLVDGTNGRALAPMALVDGTLLLTERHDQEAPSDGTYLWKLSEPAPARISELTGGTGSLNEAYAVWDDARSHSLALYDRTAGKVTQFWDTACIRPALAPDGPYVVCLDFDANVMRLLPVPSDVGTTLGGADGGGRGAIANDRAYWIQPADTNDPHGASVVDYIDLPAA